MSNFRSWNLPSDRNADARNALISWSVQRGNIGLSMENVIGILFCYSFIVILAMPDDFGMPASDEDQGPALN